MALVSQLVEQFFAQNNGELYFDGKVAVRDIAQQFGTPLFVYDGSVLDRKFAVLQKAVGEHLGIYYSVKANPQKRILECFLEKGCGLEVASVGEFFQARGAGCPAEKIFFAGPGKTPYELEVVLKERIGEIHVESFTELDRVAAIGKKLGVRPCISVRVNPSSEALGGAMRMGGKPSPFGIDEEKLEEFLTRVHTFSHIQLQGIHLFAGTQILDSQVLLAQYQKGLNLAATVSEYIGRPLQTVDFGGGLGIPYFPQDQPLNMEEFSCGINQVFAQVHRDSKFQGTTFIIEPGRFLVGESGVYVVKVNDIKVSRGKKFIVVDGGMHQHLAASGNLGQVIKKNYPIGHLMKLDQSDGETADVVGPLCTPLDTLARNILLPSVEIGDLIGIFQSGSYAKTASPLNFLSHASPPEVFVLNGNVTLLPDISVLPINEVNTV